MNRTMVLGALGALLAVAGLEGVSLAARQADEAPAPAWGPSCPRLVSRQAYLMARLARLEGDLRAEDARQEAKDGPDWECDLACAASHRLRDELESDLREGVKALRNCGVADE